MVSKKNLLNLLVGPSLVTSLLAGCGGDQSSLLSTNTPVVYQGTVYYPAGYQDPNLCCCDPATVTDEDPVADNSPEPAKSSEPSANKTPEPTKSTPPAAPENSQEKGRKILDKVLSTITTPNALEAEVDKWEKGLKDSRVVQQTFKVYNEKPGKVKIDVLYHTKASSIGAKLSFNVGTGKAVIRPGGALSFITKEMDQTDDNLTTPNGFTPEQIDFFYMTKRLGSSSYNAELIGKTTLNGSEIYLLKITKNGTNELLADINHEILGFDPKTFEVKLWELYAGNSNDAFFRINIKSFKALSDLPDDTFKV
jgi:hypothetical protein